MKTSPPPRGFTHSEFKTRTKNAQTKLSARGLSGLLVTSEPDIRYFTGFHTLFWQSPTRPWFLFIPVEGKPIAIIPEIGAALMKQSWIDDIRTWTAPCPKDDGITLLYDLLIPLAQKGKAIGIPKGHETILRMPLADWERLCARLPELIIKDATDIVQSLRMVKSKPELEKIAHICAIASATFDHVPHQTHKGQALEETFRAFRRQALAFGADDVPYLVGSAEQGGYSDVISPPAQRPLQSGDILMMDTGCVWDGYFCDFDRNWAIEYADDQAKRAYDVLWRATEAGFEVARAGNTCRDLFMAMSHIISEMDDNTGDIGRLGHGLGMQLTEQPSHANFDNTILRENMVLTLEPSLSYGNGLMMVHEENIVIGKNKAQWLSKRAPIEIPIL